MTIAALYGAGGSVIGPSLAHRLGVDFLDRAIPTAVAERTGLPTEVVAAVDERPRSRAQRLFSALARAPNLTGGPARGEQGLLDEQRLRSEINTFLAQACRSGGVVLGRGGAVVLRTVPGALHVHLGGPTEARVTRAMEIQGVDRATAERRLKVNDRARIEYVKDAYGVDGEDPSLYHLVIDATAFTIDACVDLLVDASNLRPGPDSHP